MAGKFCEGAKGSRSALCKDHMKEFFRIEMWEMSEKCIGY